MQVAEAAEAAPDAPVVSAMTLGELHEHAAADARRTLQAATRPRMTPAELVQARHPGRAVRAGIRPLDALVRTALHDQGTVTEPTSPASGYVGNARDLIRNRRL